MIPTKNNKKTHKMDITQKCIDFFSIRQVKSNLEKYGLVYDEHKVKQLLMYLSNNKQEINHDNIELHIAALYYRVKPYITPPTNDAYPKNYKIIKDNEKL